jgi:hypothetical protein
MKKISALLMASVVMASGAQAHNNDASGELAALKQQVEAQSKKIDELTMRVCPAANGGAQVVNTFGDGYVAIPGANTGISFIINPRLDASYDAGPNAGDVLGARLIPLKDYDKEAHKSGHFQIDPRQTIFGFKTKTTTSRGDVGSHLELDFFNDGNSSFSPRLRHAYLTFAGFTVGQTTTAFQDWDAAGRSVDAVGTLGGNTRQALIRYDAKLHENVGGFVSAERPFGDFTYSTGAPVAPGATDSKLQQLTPSGNSNHSSSGYSVSQIPDFVVGVKFANQVGHFGLRGLVREINFKKNDIAVANHRTGKKTTTAFGASARVFVMGSHSIFGQVNAGQGIGRYLPDSAGQAAFVNLDSTNAEYGQLKTVSSRHWLAGFQLSWSDSVKTNVAYSQLSFTVPKGVPDLSVLTKDEASVSGTNYNYTRFNKRIDRLFINTIYSPVKSVEIGLEYGYSKRETADKRTGKAHRIAFMTSYKF